MEHLPNMRQLVAPVKQEHSHTLPATNCKTHLFALVAGQMTEELQACPGSPHETLLDSTLEHKSPQSKPQPAHRDANDAARAVLPPRVQTLPGCEASTVEGSSSSPATREPTTTIPGSSTATFP
jgi:hypothetical protein